MAIVNISTNIFEQKADSIEVEYEVLGDVVKNYVEGLPEVYEQLECYDAETGETFYAEFEYEGYNTVCVANGQEVDLDYEIMPDDVLYVVMVPASSEAPSAEHGEKLSTAGGWTIGAGAGLVVAGGIMLAMGLAAGPFGAFVAVAGIALLAIGGVTAVVGSALLMSGEDEKSKAGYQQTGKGESESLLSVTGGSNQEIVGQRIPFIMGKHLVNPLVAGSAYHETRTEDTSTYKDNGQYFTQLYCVGYGPLKLTNFKIGDTFLAYNQDMNGNTHPTYMHGTLSSCLADDKGDILNKWKNNDIQLEILQKGSLCSGTENKWGNLYNVTVEELEANATALFICDKSIQENADKIYKGVSVPNGYRTNSIRVSRACPYKLQVEVDMPSGLYATRQEPTSGSSDTFYYKIPLRIGVQWRYSKKNQGTSYANDPTGWTDFTSLLTYKNGNWVRTSPTNYTAEIALDEAKSNLGADISQTSASAALADMKNEKWTQNVADADGNEVRHKVFNIGGGSKIENRKKATEFDDKMNEGRLVFEYEFTDEQIKKIINFDSTASNYDSVEVRVVRVTPSYIDEWKNVADDYSQMTYQDIVKWSYLRTWSFDKDKYKTALKNGTVTPTSGSKFVQNYPLRPIKEEDLDKFCFVALRLKQDVAETGGGSLNQLSVIAESFCPKYNITEDKWYPETLNRKYKYFSIPSDPKEKYVPITKAEYEAGGNVFKSANGNDFTDQIKADIFESGNQLTSEVAGKYITANTASVALLSLVGGHNGKDAHTYEGIDLASFAEHYVFCEDVTDGTTKDNETVHFKYCCNGVVSNEKKLETLLSSILVTGRANYCLSSENKYKVIIGRNNPYPITVLNSKNVISKSNERSFADTPSGFYLSFIDAEDNYNPNDLYVMNDREDFENPSKDIEQLSIDYITDREQLWSIARFNLASRIQQRESYTRTIGYLGLTLEFGDTVLLQDDSLLIGTDHGGRITKLIDDDKKIYGVLLDEMYELTGELDEDGKCAQGCTIVQPNQYGDSRCVTLRFKNPSAYNGGFTLNGKFIPYGVGKTNAILFEYPIKKDTGRPDSDITDVDFCYVTPEEGNVVAIGVMGKITQKAVVTGIKPSEKNTFTVTLVPYNESLYEAGGVIPEFQANMTLPQRPENEQELNNDVSLSMVQAIATRSANVIAASIVVENLPPDPVTESSAKVYQDYIAFDCVVEEGKKNVMNKFSYVITKKDGTTATIESSSSENRYYFDRLVDGYPEKEDLLDWSYKINVENQCGLTNEGETEFTMDLSDYGSWTLSKPTYYVRVSDRTISFIMGTTRSDGRTQYGRIKYAVSVKRFDDTKFYAPKLNANVYPVRDSEGVITEGNEYNYKDTSSTADYVYSDATYIQTMPLKDQTTDNLKDTQYTFRIRAVNEAGVSEFQEFNATALCTSISDIVHANKNDKEYYVQRLSAISANVGLISQGGFGDFKDNENYWALSNLSASEAGTSSDIIGGSFRVGGEDEYIEVSPRIEDGVKKFSIRMKAGNISLTSEGMGISDGTFFYDSENENRRLHLTSSGIVIQERVNDVWSASAKVFIDSQGNLTISNSTENPVTGYELGTGFVYHFDENINDQTGNNSKNITTNGQIEAKSIVGSAAFWGGVSFSNNSDKGVGFWTKSNLVTFEGFKWSEEIEKFNHNASSDWGLTDSQITTNIFKA